MKRNKKVIISIFAFIFGIAFLSISYAALTTTLYINGDTNVLASKWKIKFANLQNVVKKGYAEEVVKPTINTNDTKISTYSVTLLSPGDEITYLFDVVNDGDFDAEISSLVKNTPTCSGENTTDENNICNNIEYTLTYTTSGSNYNIGDEVSIGDTLDINETRGLKLTLKLSDSLTADKLPTSDVTINNLGITIIYSQKVNNTPVTPPAPKPNNIYTVVSGDTKTIGSEICIGNECFYVIGRDGTKIKMLAKWNLKVGNIFEYKEYPSGGYITSKAGEYTSSDAGYGLQSSDAIGHISWENKVYGTVQFSDTTYWLDASNKTKSEYTNNYIFDSNSTVYPYVTDYVDYLNTQNVTVEGRLMTLAEAQALGCVISPIRKCENTPSWLSQTSFWIGTTSSGNFVYNIQYDYKFGSTHYGSKNYSGVRPVIIMEE